MIIFIRNHKFLCVFILLVIFLFSPAKIAINVEDIDKTRTYIIAEMHEYPDANFHVIYDSQNRDITYIYVEKNFLNYFLNFCGFNNDIMKNLNVYVIYTDENNIRYMDTGNTLIMNNYDIDILYPIKRDNILESIYPKRFVFRFETIPFLK